MMSNVRFTSHYTFQWIELKDWYSCERKTWVSLRTGNFFLFYSLQVQCTLSMYPWMVCERILRELTEELSQLFTLDLEGRMGLEVMEGLEGLDGRVVLRFVIGATENMSSSSSSPNNGSATIKNQSLWINSTYM